VSGFPRWVALDESFSVEMYDWKEFLYRRNMLFVEDPNEFTLFGLYRIYVKDDVQTTNGVIGDNYFEQSAH